MIMSVVIVQIPAEMARVFQTIGTALRHALGDASPADSLSMAAPRRSRCERYSGFPEIASAVGRSEAGVARCGGPDGWGMGEVWRLRCQECEAALRSFVFGSIEMHWFSRIEPDCHEHCERRC